MTFTSHRHPVRKGMLAVAASVWLAALTASTTFVGVVDQAAAATDNRCSNPVLAANLNGWGSLDGAPVSRDPVGDLPEASWAFDTAGRSFYMPELSVTPGRTWTFSAQDRVVFGSGTAAIAVDWYDAGGAYLGEKSGTAVQLPTSTATGGTWTTVSASFTVPAHASTAHVLQFGAFGSATGTDFKATKCDYELTTNEPSDSAAVRYGWGKVNTAESDEFNGTSVDLSKWGLFGADPGKTTGCSPGYNKHGQRCASQTKEGGGYLSVTGTANGVTGGLYGRVRPFRYGRVEVRERAVPLSSSGAPYHAVPLMWPQHDTDWTKGEIDFAERDVASPKVYLFVHHDGTQDPCSFAVDSTRFHNYAIDWEPTSVTWYVDGNQICTVGASITVFDKSNGGAQLDMLPPSGTLMQAARQDVDSIRMYPVPATQYA